MAATPTGMPGDFTPMTPAQTGTSLPSEGTIPRGRVSTITTTARP